MLVCLAVMACSGEKANEGDAFFNKEQYDQAISAYSEYLEVNPNDLNTLYKRARAYEAIGDEAKAVEQYRYIISKDNEHVDAHLSLGGHFYKIDQNDDALFHYERALDKDPNNSTGYVQRGKTHQKLGDLKKAMEDYNLAISINDSEPAFYIARGSLRLVMNQSSQACNDFKLGKSLGSEEADDIIKKYCK